MKPDPVALPGCLSACWWKADGARPLSPFLGLFTPDPATPFASSEIGPHFPAWSEAPFFLLLSLSLRLPFFNPISPLIFSLLTFCCLSRSLARAARREIAEVPGTFYLGEGGRERIRGHKRTR